METGELGSVWLISYSFLAFLIVGVMVWRILRKKGSPFS